MRSIRRFALAAAVAVVAAAGASAAAPVPAGLKAGKVTLQSGGPITFGPDGVLYVGDPKAAAVYAVATGDTQPQPAAPVAIDNLSSQLAGLLGVKPEDVQVNDLAVNPVSNRVYLSVSRGKGPDAIPVLFSVTGKGELKEVSLESVPSAKAELAKAQKRPEAITNLKVVSGKLYVAGLSTEEFASTLRAIPLPFDGTATASAVEIYHGAHGKYETKAPIRTFTPVEVNGKEEILAAYLCTPLVRIPVTELKDGAKVKGKTVAELGNMNRPLDMVVYTKGGAKYALIANDRRGVIKVDLGNLAAEEAITNQVRGTAGLKYETQKELTGVEQLDKLGDAHAVLLVRKGGVASVKTIELP